jgi:hypothetical protein
LAVGVFPAGAVFVIDDQLGFGGVEGDGVDHLLHQICEGETMRSGSCI